MKRRSAFITGQGVIVGSNRNILIFWQGLQIRLNGAYASVAV